MKSSDSFKWTAGSLAISVVLGLCLLYPLNSGAAYDPAGTRQSSQAEDIGQSSVPRANRGSEVTLPLAEEAAAVLGIAAAGLYLALAKGQSLADAAAELGVGQAELTGRLLTLRVQNINTAKAHGKLTADMAERIKRQMEKHLGFMLSLKGLPLSPPENGRDAEDPLLAVWITRRLAQLVGITRADLLRRVGAGQSLTEIAADCGISRTELGHTLQRSLLL